MSAALCQTGCASITTTCSYNLPDSDSVYLQTQLLSHCALQIPMHLNISSWGQVRRLVRGAELLTGLGLPLPLQEITSRDKDAALQSLRTLLARLARSDPSDARWRSSHVSRLQILFLLHRIA